MTALTSKVTFGVKHRRLTEIAAPPSRPPRIARLVALAHLVDEKVATGVLRDHTHAASVLGISSPRLSQLLNLLHLAPIIQQQILLLEPNAKGRQRITERALRPIVALVGWDAQVEAWNDLMKEPRL